MSIENYGKYQLIKKLAMGGMAQIYLARQRGPEGFEKLLVIKRILPHLAENDEFIRMFLDEARIAARLDHPNIVQIYDLGSQDDSFFIAMEYIHGEDLRKVWKRAERSGELIPVPLVCRIMIEACAGLDHAHKKVDGSGKPLNIVHRDISPQNILLTFEGRVKVVDFGIAKAADQATVTRSGMLKGKYSYMSPEQAAGQKVDRRSDIFALGVVLYELLTGTRLFKRTTDMATLQAVAACDIQPPSKLDSRVPEDLDPIVMKALAREPGDRYAEALEFQLALEDWLVAHRHPSSSAHVAAFMKELYAARLAEEARLGDVLVDEAEAPAPSGGARASDKGEKSSESMKSPRQVDTGSSAPRREPTDRHERTPPRTSARPSRSELRPAPSDRKQAEPEARRTVDIRRVSDPQTEDPRHSDATSSEEETLIPRPSRPRNPAVEPSARSSERRSNRLALLGMGGGVLVGLVLGGWWALRSEPAPQAGTVTAKPSSSTEPTAHEELVQPEQPREESKPAVAEAVQTPPKTESGPSPAPIAKPPEKSPAVAAPVREEHKSEPTRPAAIVERPASQSGRGTVRFAVTPWADVSCDGRKLGTTPLPDVSLVAGVYECKFANPELGTIKTQRVEVKPNSHTRVVVKF